LQKNGARGQANSTGDEANSAAGQGLKEEPPEIETACSDFRALLIVYS
jgi:hypothetical protein